MIVTRYQDLDTWQLTEEFKTEVFRLLEGCQAASRNFRYRDQILNAAGAPSKHVAEGFARKSPGDFCRFLNYAVSSVAETENHLKDGVEQRYFTALECRAARQLAYRCTRALLSLKRSQERYIAAQQAEKTQLRRRRAR